MTWDTSGRICLDNGYYTDNEYYKDVGLKTCPHCGKSRFDTSGTICLKCGAKEGDANCPTQS